MKAGIAIHVGLTNANSLLGTVRYMGKEDTMPVSASLCFSICTIKQDFFPHPETFKGGSRSLKAQAMLDMSSSRDQWLLFKFSR